MTASLSDSNTVERKEPQVIRRGGRLYGAAFTEKMAAAKAALALSSKVRAGGVKRNKSLRTAAQKRATEQLIAANRSRALQKQRKHVRSLAKTGDLNAKEVALMKLITMAIGKRSTRRGGDRTDIPKGSGRPKRSATPKRRRAATPKPKRRIANYWKAEARLNANAANRSYSKKYLSRPSPGMSARIAHRTGQTYQRGNDGGMYRIQMRSNGSPFWVKA